MHCGTLGYNVTGNYDRTTVRRRVARDAVRHDRLKAEGLVPIGKPMSVLRLK
jgi:hypothetical protein